jgi:hypothetical protein
MHQIIIRKAHPNDWKNSLNLNKQLLPNVNSKAERYIIMISKNDFSTTYTTNVVAEIDLDS